MISIECPYCSTITGSSHCENCDADVGAFIHLRTSAEHAYAQVWSLAREKKLTEAISRMGLGQTLYHDERFRKLAGWLHFLVGNVNQAVEHWGQVPEEAKRAADSFNSALEALREGRIEEARRLLDRIEVPLAAAARLGGAINGREAVTGGTSDSRVSMRWNSHWWVAGAAVFLVGVGTLAGYFLKNGGQDRLESYAIDVTGPSLSSEGAKDPPGEDGNPTEAILRAFLVREPAAVYQISSPQVLANAPIPVALEIPDTIRNVVAQGWYLDGLRAYRRGNQHEAEISLLSSLASIDPQADLYWADDATYYLVMVYEEQGEAEKARSVAEILVQAHPLSIYVNSRIKTLLSPLKENSP